MATLKYSTVGELREALADCNPDAMVGCFQDSPLALGNGKKLTFLAPIDNVHKFIQNGVLHAVAIEPLEGNTGDSV